MDGHSAYSTAPLFRKGVSFGGHARETYTETMPQGIYKKGAYGLGLGQGRIGLGLGSAWLCFQAFGRLLSLYFYIFLSSLESIDWI